MKRKKKKQKGKIRNIANSNNKNITDQFKSSTKFVITIIITAVITTIVEKSCDRIVPDNPIVIKDEADTIRHIHTYDLSQFTDSATNAQLRYNLENIKLAQAYENVTRNNKNGVYNSIKIDARFPNAKGYSIGDAASYFALDMLAKEKFIDFDLSFYDAAIIDKIYCLSLKIIRIEKEERVCVLDENYTPNKHTNKIRISNTLPKGAYQIEVGFILNNDRNEVYPRFYRAYKSYIKN